MTTITRTFLVLIFATLLINTTSVTAGEENPAETRANALWTVLIYLDADNNLESYAITDFLEMATVGSNAEVKVVVQLDRIDGYDTSHGDWTDTRRGLVSADDTPTATWGEGIGEANMGDPQTLVDFLQWGMAQYPADNYAVILWNHGGGWRTVAEDPDFKAVCWDDTNGGDALYTKELREALVSAQGPGDPVALIGFDACLMGMVEVAYELRTSGEVMVASEETEPATGWPYHTLLADLAANPSMTAPEFGTTIVERYYESMGSSQTQAAINLSQMNALASQIDSLAGTLLTNWNTDETACATAAAALKTSISNTVIHERHGSFWPGSHGLAIYFPAGLIDAEYNDSTIQFPGSTQWDEFLQDYQSLMADSWVAQARSTSQTYTFSLSVDLYDFCENLIASVPNNLAVEPNQGFTASGPEGGPFAPVRRTYTLINHGSTQLEWSASSAVEWLTFFPSTGTLTSGESTTLRASLNEMANSLPASGYTGTFSFTNVATDTSHSRPVTLFVGTTDRFTELFSSSDLDLANHSLTLFPNNSDSGYTAHCEPATAFQSDPTGGSPLSLGDDDSTQVTLAGSQQLSLYGASYPAFHIGANGYITFGAGDSAHIENLDTHFSLPRISALFDDLDPTAAGNISWKQLPDRVAVTWVAVPQFGTTDGNNFQVEMFFDGVIRITWLELAATDGLVGISAGNGVPADFHESNLDSYNPPPPTITRHPLPLTAILGTNARLSVETSGTGPYTYQWRFNGIDIPGAQSSTCYIYVVPESAGLYDVVVSNDGGSVTSNTAQLTISSEILASGSFETGLEGWTADGNVTIQSGAPYTTTNGSQLIAFNSENSSPNGVLLQRFVTQSGSRYVVEFDAGVLAYSLLEQRLQVDVVGSTTLLSDTILNYGPGGGNTRWLSKRYEFVADSTITTLIFRDVSLQSNGLDLVLDHVRVYLKPIFALSIDSSPTAGIGIDVSPLGLGSEGDGTTSFERYYYDGSTVDLTAPASVPGLVFQKWVKNGADWTSNRQTTVLIDTHTSMTAAYLPLSIPEITSPATMVCMQGHPFDYDIMATNYPTAYDASPLPEGLSHQTDSNLISGIATTPGTYQISLAASNHLGTDSAVMTLTVLPAPSDYLTELFDDSPNDTAHQSFTFTPDGSPSFYSVTRRTAIDFPTDPVGGIPLQLTDDSSIEVILDGNAEILFFGTSYKSFHVCSNGYVTFGIGDCLNWEHLTDHFSLPRISALFDDLNPGTSGAVSWQQLADRVTVTFDQIPEYAAEEGNGNSFQIEMYFDGRIRITLLELTASDGLIGLSRGLGAPVDFPESDFSNYPLESGLAITPPEPFQSSGSIGGPFLPEQKTYTLTNSGNAAITWTAMSNVDWLSIQPTTGTLDPNTTATITALIKPDANSLPLGKHLAELQISTDSGDFALNSSLTIVPLPPVITSPLAANGYSGVYINYQIEATGDPTQYGASSLPDGLNLNPSTGQIWGTLAATAQYSFSITATNAGGTGTATLIVTVQPAPPVYLSENLDSDPGWLRDGVWAYGTPTGGGGTYGSPDPSTGATGTHVFGVNLNGDYSTTPGGPYYLTAGPFDLTECQNSILRFQRWLNIERTPFARANIEVSTDGVTWSPVWSNSDTTVTDSSWQQVSYDISAVADHGASVYLRWGYSVFSGAWAFSGWNIDDIEILGSPTGSTPIMVTTLADENDGALGQGTGDSLREAIEAVNSSPGQNTILFDPALNGGTILLGGSQLLLTSDVIIDASALPEGIAVSGNEESRVFEIKEESNVSILALTIKDGFVSEQNGGGILNSGILLLKDVTISTNRAISNQWGGPNGAGGGIFNDGDLDIESSTISGNRVFFGWGGGIANSGWLNLKNTTVCYNFTEDGGAGGVGNGGIMTLLQSTVSGNSVYYGYGGNGIVSYGALSIENSIVAGNTAYHGGEGDLKGDNITLLGNNILSGNPSLAPSGDYGGRTKTMPPLAGSAAIDAGIASQNTPAFDQRGRSRPSGTAPDIGAVELQQIIVDTLVDEDDGIETGGISLRDAIDPSLSPPADLVLFDPTLNGGTIVLEGTQLIVASDVAIDASALPAGIAVSGNEQSRVFQIAAESNVSMIRMTIKDGYVSELNGGGILNSGILHLKDVSISANQAISYQWDSTGAGIFNDGELDIESSSILWNEIFFGYGGGIYNSGTIHMKSSTVCGNHTQEGNGGGVSNDGTMILLHSTVSGNSVWYGGGGGIESRGATLSVENSIIAGNTGYDLAEDDLMAHNITLLGNNILSGNPCLASGDYGGLTWTMAPQAGSPAIDAALATQNTPAFDQRGRNRSSGAAIDIGAVEIQQTLVNTLADEGDGVGTGGTSLRDAIDPALSPPTELVRFDTNLSGGTIILESGQFVIEGLLGIDASNLPQGITLDGNAISRILKIEDGATASLDSITLMRGKSIEPGGGILNSGALDVNRCTISNCLSFDDGGGIASFGYLNIVNTTIAGNLAAGNGGGVSSHSYANIEHTTLSENSAFFGHGGGIANGDYLSLLNSIVADNEAWSDPNVSGPFNIGSWWVDIPNLISGIPRLAPLASYGGPTPTMPPLPNSPAIDTAMPFPTSPPLDQRNSPRPAGPHSDLGAVEAFPFSSLALVDSDGDRIDDRLEAAYQMTVGVDDSGRDSDGDGSSDAEELANMTDPLDSTSLLKILSFTKASDFDAVSNPVFDVTFASFPGLSYTLECDQDLDFLSPNSRVLPLGVAEDFMGSVRIMLKPGHDFLRVSRDP